MTPQTLSLYREKITKLLKRFNEINNLFWTVQFSHDGNITIFDATRNRGMYIADKPHRTGENAQRILMNLESLLGKTEFDKIWFQKNPEGSSYEHAAEMFLHRHGIKFSYTYLGQTIPANWYPIGKEKYHNTYTATFSRAGRRISFRFHDSIANTQAGIDYLSAYSVLAGIQKYEPPDSMEDFAAEYGYPLETREDLIKVKKIYAAVWNEWKKVKNFFTDNELREMEDIQ